MCSGLNLNLKISTRTSEANRVALFAHSILVVAIFVGQAINRALQRRVISPIRNRAGQVTNTPHKHSGVAATCALVAARPRARQTRIIAKIANPIN